MSKNVSSFTQFLNDFGIRAFDELAARRAVAETDSSEEPSPLDRLATRWSALKPAEKEEVVKRLLLAGSAVGLAVPAIARARRTAKTRKAKGRATKAPSAKAPAAALPEKPSRKRDKAKTNEKKGKQAKKKKKEQKKLLKEAKRKEKKEKKQRRKQQKVAGRIRHT